MVTVGFNEYVKDGKSSCEVIITLPNKACMHLYTSAKWLEHLKAQSVPVGTRIKNTAQ